MTKPEKIAQSPWDFTLYKVDGKYIISVAFSEQITDYSICYRLLDNELDQVNNIEYLSNLSKRIREDRMAFSDRETPNPMKYN